MEIPTVRNMDFTRAMFIVQLLYIITKIATIERDD